MRSPHVFLGLASFLVAVGCQPAAAPHRPAPPPAAPVADPFAELDPGEVTPVWPTLPPLLRSDIAANIPREAPLALARARLPQNDLGFRLDDPDLEKRVRGYLEALYALENIAFGAPSTDLPEAEALLVRFWAVARGFDQLARAAQRDDDRAAFKALFDASDRQGCAFAVRVLRHKTPDVIDLSKLAISFDRSGEIAKGRILWRLIVTRAPDRLSAGDWIDVAANELAGEDTVASEQALAHARKLLGGPIPDTELARIRVRQLGVSLRELELRQARVIALMAAAKGTGLDAELAQADLLLETAQWRAGDGTIATLYKAHPEDARVRSRMAQAIMRASHDGGVPIPTATVGALDVIRRPGLVQGNAELAAYTVGLDGMTALALVQSPSAGASKQTLLKYLATLQHDATELAAFDPGRAAALSFLLDRISIVFAASDPAAALFGSVTQWIVDVERLIATYPQTEDLFRIYYSLAPLAMASARRIIGTEPPPPAENDADLAVQRARVASMQAADTLTPEWIALARRTAEAIPASTDDDVEGQRCALRADAMTLDAGTDAGKWRAIADLYAVARPLLAAPERPRIDNNRAFALTMAGSPAEARALFTASADVDGEMRWVPALNGGFADTADRKRRLEIVELLEGSMKSDDVPPALHAWHAELSDDPKVKRAQAKALAASMTGVLGRARQRRDLGVALELRWILRLEASSARPTYAMGAAFDGVMWLAPRPPLAQKK